MRWGSITREAIRNVTSGASMARVLGIAASLGLAGLAISDARAIQNIFEGAAEFRHSVASVMVVSSEGGISGEACDALSSIPGIETSGATRYSSLKIVATALPSDPIPEVNASPGLIELLGMQAVRAGVFVGPDVVGALGSDQAIPTLSGDIPIAGQYAYPSDGRRAGLGWAVMTPVDAGGDFDECWAEIWPYDPQLSQLLLTTINISPSSSPQLAQLNTSLGERYDLQDKLVTRPTAIAVAGSAVVFFVLGVLAIWSRRTQFASALHAGVRRSAMAWMAFLESSVWILASFFISGFACFAVALAGIDAGRAAALLAFFKIACVGVLSAYAGIFATVGAIREHKLFTYFKQK